MSYIQSVAIVAKKKSNTEQGHWATIRECGKDPEKLHELVEGGLLSTVLNTVFENDWTETSTTKEFSAAMSFVAEYVYTHNQPNGAEEGILLFFDGEDHMDIKMLPLIDLLEEFGEFCDGEDYRGFKAALTELHGGDLL